MYRILIVLFLFALLYIVMWPFYQAFNHIDHAQRDYNETLTDRMEYIESVMRRRHYVPMETLPSVRFDTNLGTLAGESLKCMSVPLFVSELNLPMFDCTEVCDDPRAAYFLWERVTCLWSTAIN